MKNYYDKNYRAFLIRHPLYEYMEKEECEQCKVIVERDQKGNEVWGIVREEYVWFLGSMYDNEYYKQVWLDSIELKNIQAIVYLFGFGDIDLIRRTIAKFPDNRVVIYEPDLSYMKYLMKRYDLEEMILNPNVVLLAGNEGMQHLEKLNNGLIEITNYRDSVYRENLQYKEIYTEKYNEWNNALNYKISNIMLNKNTVLKFGQNSLNNIIKNLYDCIKSKNILEAMSVIRSKMNDTAVLVSAGPSLNKNIELLKAVKDKAFIIAVDTAIKPVLKSGVRPDMTVTIDSCKPKELFLYNGKMADIPMVVCLSGNSEVIEEYLGKRIYEYDFIRCFGEIYRKMDFMSVALSTAGSVANNAFSFLVRTGFKNIILIGQDLAYSHGKRHAEDTFSDRRMIDFTKRDVHFEVEDIYGDMVYTEYNMNQYRMWFENVIKEHPELNVIDATEGGAKIEGTVIMTFKEAIDEYVAGLPEVRYEKLIADMPDVEEEEIRRRLEVFYEFPRLLDETKLDMEELMKAYDELEKMNNIGDYSSKKFKQIVKKVDKLSKQVENSIYSSLMARMKDEEEYDILGEIYAEQGSVYDEFKLIIESGRRMINSYIARFDEIRGMMVREIEKAKLDNNV